MQTRRSDKLTTDNHLEIRLKCNSSLDVHSNRIPRREFDFDFLHLRGTHILPVVLKIVTVVVYKVIKIMVVDS